MTYLSEDKNKSRLVVFSLVVIVLTILFALSGFLFFYTFFIAVVLGVVGSVVSYISMKRAKDDSNKAPRFFVLLFIFNLLAMMFAAGLTALYVYLLYFMSFT